ncbi:alpha/beta hydrolase family protein, partial [Winogradskyella sp.]
SKSWSAIKSIYINNINSKKSNWDSVFGIADIESSKDNTIQKAYYYQTKSKSPKPLIVSLHTWSGDYTQYDELAELCRIKDLNYIHPDFRGPNNSTEACCSNLVLSDIDDAISYALVNFNVDENEIYVIGFSGGGYATLSTFMKSKHKIKKFSAWASISDLVGWHKESKILQNFEYVDDILRCTESDGKLNMKIAKQKSPINWQTPVHKLEHQKLNIYAGIYDGLQGSVPITHSINFYNKVLTDLNVRDSTHYVSEHEKLFLLEKREPLGHFGNLSDRQISLKKTYKNMSLEIFEGEHEILSEYALNELLSSN